MSRHECGGFGILSPVSLVSYRPGRRCLRRLMFVSCLAPSVLAAQALPDTTLLGLWGSEVTYGPLVRGALTVVRTGASWTARIAGYEIVPRVERDSIRVALPNGQGEFRGRVSGGGAAMTGFWVQSVGVVSGAAYAFPLRLTRTGASGAAGTAGAVAVWRGDVEPLDERFSLYALIERHGDGSLWASFHNPEANSRGGAARFRVERSGAVVRFVDTSATSGGGAAREIAGTYDSAQRQITVPWSDLGRPIVLTPRTRDDAVGLYARSPAAAPYQYRAPLAGDDGWTAATAASQGLDAKRLAALVQQIADGDPANDTTSLIQSVLVARHGKLVLEEYFYGFGRDRPHDSRSAAKTFASVMVGAAMMRGLAIGPSTPIPALFRHEAPFGNPDPRKERITLAHLMTHSTGLACDDNGDPEPGNEDVMQNQQAQPDWYKYILDLPMRRDPGERYLYCSGTMNLVGGAVASVAGEGTWLPALFDDWIAKPLQFTHYYMNLMPTGQAYFGGGMYVRPRDLLKVGVAYLNGGVWNGRRIVTRAWANQSTTQQIGPPQATGTDGFAWHLNTLVSGGRQYREYEASGNGGQLVIVLPELDMAVLFTGGDYNRYRIWRRWRDDLVPQYVIPAATGKDR